MKFNATLSNAWDQLGEIRNRIKDIVKERMGWKADAVFYDRVKGRVPCTPAEREAFNSAFKTVSVEFKSVINVNDLFPASDLQLETIE
jgi:hypothetical protein